MPDRARKRPLIVPIFIPTQGCPHRCVYCRQEGITGTTGPPSHGQVKETLLGAVRSPRFQPERSPEIAFYGGTFTGLSLETMEALLSVVHPWVAEGPFCGVRVSTRPDALDRERLSLMKRYGVATVELGVQSLDDRVLGRSLRGYTAGAVQRAVPALRAAGFRVGVQLMPGLPGDSRARWRNTVTKALALEPDLVRLYPTVVLEGTRLAAWYRKSRYRPLTLDEAVDRCSEACVRFAARDIPVVRLGLLVSPESLDQGEVLAGPWHPAFGDLVRSSVYHQRLEALLPADSGGDLRISVHPADEPLLRGYRNRGTRALKRKTRADSLEIRADDRLPPGSPIVETVSAAPGPAGPGGLPRVTA